MIQLPEQIARTLTELKKRYKYTVSIKLIKGGYYAYEEFTKWDKIIKKRRTYSVYLGKIEQDGTLISPHRKKVRTETRSIGGYLKNISEEKKEKKAKELELYEEAIIKALSTNARASVEELSRTVNLSPSTLNYQMKRLESKYGITYTIDTYTAYNFGFYRFIITVRFKDRKPPIDSIKQILGKDPHVQLVMLTKGYFDLFIYLLFENTVSLENWIYDLRKSNVFASCRAEWNVSYFLIGHGIIPFRDEFFDLIKGKIWHRTSDTPRKLSGQIFNREYAVLKALNKNGLTKFRDIDKDYGLNPGSAQYTYHELVKSGVIRRVTISMSKLPIRYRVIVIMKQINIQQYASTRNRYFSYTLQDEGLLTNKLSLMGDLGSPYGQILILPMYSDTNPDKIEEELRKVIKGVKLQTTVITDIVLGSICDNKIEKESTFMYDKLDKQDQYLKET
ncbi:MAG: Lrp/AsnC family transcriptional regulator [Candidatus Marsarchaeota archaeon]|jgi:DNA-binding Lrp family transcriptional regulator|nr:Lrp/AsnC family transcriptional regulator [Candidatus Marsarchaeota archaeon]MCL5111973.1 Lrp/AsnC family transcriptional regulator [Candidatus Marsarchaeota archaeon]